MPLPEYGKWRLKHPFTGNNPPFPILEVDLVSKTGSAGLNMQWYPLLHIMTRPGDSVFLARYKVKEHSGMLEATYLADKSLKVVFNGSVDAECDGQLISARGSIEGAPTPPMNIADVAESHPIRCAGDIARWFDGLVMENEQELKRLCDNFARRNPDSWVAVGLANTTRDLYSVVARQGAGLVDTLRLGEGCYEGGWGIGKDALRALNFIPVFQSVRPLARRLSSLRGVRSAEAAAEGAAAEGTVYRAAAQTPATPAGAAPAAPKLPGPLATDYPKEGICWAVAAVNAVQLFRARFWMSVGQFMRACGITSAEIYELRPIGRSISSFKDALRNLGIHLCELTGVQPLMEATKIFDLVKNLRSGSVVLFGVAWEKGAHLLVAWKDPATDAVYIIDRTSEATGKVYRSLAELDAAFPGYRGIADSILKDAYVLENCTGGFIQSGGKILFALGFATALTIHGLDPKKPEETPNQNSAEKR